MSMPCLHAPVVSTKVPPASMRAWAKNSAPLIVVGFVCIEQRRHGDSVHRDLERPCLLFVAALEGKRQLLGKKAVVFAKGFLIHMWQWIVAGHAQDRPDA